MSSTSIFFGVISYNHLWNIALHTHIMCPAHLNLPIFIIFITTNSPYILYNISSSIGDFLELGQLIYIISFFHHNLYGNAVIIRTLKSRRLGWAEHVAQMGDGRKVHKILLRKPEGTHPCGRPKIR